MSNEDQKELGNTLWRIADDLRGSMNADDFRDYMLSFLFLRYLSDNYETAVRKELGKDYPRSEEHTSELQSRQVHSYAVLCFKNKFGGHCD